MGLPVSLNCRDTMLWKGIQIGIVSTVAVVALRRSSARIREVYQKILSSLISLASWRYRQKALLDPNGISRVRILYDCRHVEGGCLMRFRWTREGTLVIEDYKKGEFVPHNPKFNGLIRKEVAEFPFEIFRTHVAKKAPSFYDDESTLWIGSTHMPGKILSQFLQNNLSDITQLKSLRPYVAPGPLAPIFDENVTTRENLSTGWRIRLLSPRFFKESAVQFFSLETIDTAFGRRERCQPTLLEDDAKIANYCKKNYDKWVVDTGTARDFLYPLISV